MASGHHLLAGLAIALCLEFVAAADMKIHFPRSNSTKFPRLQLLGTLPPLREFTFCAWVRPFHSPNNYSTIFSYATAQIDNELLFLLFNNTGEVRLQIYRAGKLKPVECFRWPIGTWQHLCVSWLGATGVAKTIVNDIRCSDVNFGEEAPIVPSGGVAIIGQEQDAPGSEFDHTQSWYGDISSIHMWDQVLPDDKIKDLGRCSGERKIKGNVINWNETPMVAFDGVITSKSEHCST